MAESPVKRTCTLFATAPPLFLTVIRILKCSPPSSVVLPFSSVSFMSKARDENAGGAGELVLLAGTLSDALDVGVAGRGAPVPAPEEPGAAPLPPPAMAPMIAPTAVPSVLGVTLPGGTLFAVNVAGRLDAGS